MLLEIRNLKAFYGGLQALWDVELDVAEREAVAILGPNGAGKTTLLKALFGLVEYTGEIRVSGRRLSGPPEVRAELMAYVMEGRRLFPGLSVRDNLLIAAKRGSERDLPRLYALFPRLRDLESRLAYGLSGGEAQMVAIGRALLRRPHLLLLDEPSLGLAPTSVSALANVLKAVWEWGVEGVILVEQNLGLALEVCERVCVMHAGSIRHVASRSSLDPEVIQGFYLGGEPPINGQALQV